MPCLTFPSESYFRVSAAPENTGNLLKFNNPAGKLQNVVGKVGIPAVLVSWLDGTVMSVGRSSSSLAQLEIVHTLLVVVILSVNL